MKRQRWLLFILALAMLLLAACGGGDGSQSEAVRAGREIYETGGDSRIPCLTCHTLDGTTLVGPSFQGFPEHAGSRIPGMSAEEYIHQSIVNPGAYVVEGFQNSMNSNYAEFLSEEDIDNLTAYIMSLE
jgi:mono/diheme cytochrome c family protein